MGGRKKDVHFYIDCSDKRNEFLYDALKEERYRVSVYRADAAYSDDFTGERVFLFAPAAELIPETAQKIPAGSRVFCFMCEERVHQIFLQNGVTVHKYFDDELLAMKNAYLTAEGALAIIIENTDSSVRDMRVLVLGGGRVGKSVAKLLHDNRCSVFVATIDPTEYAFASIFSGVYYFSEYPKHLHKFDLIVNTVPEIVLKGEDLEKIKKDCFILDLASKPGGVDFEEARRLGLKTAHALGIPGKTAPRSAGLAIKESVLNTLGG
ncbi:MAG: hypothetical protein FWH03_05685 [Firmicutes bacterium]|nr:hypothetical protein [Bacillota bacterium]